MLIEAREEPAVATTQQHAQLHIGRASDFDRAVMEVLRCVRATAV